MQISVIIPTFNRAHTLWKAVQSVLFQKGTDLEVLIVDDGSSDNTRELIQKNSFRYKNLRYFYQSNKGPSAARNLGIKAAQGNYMAFLDSDDEWLAGKLNAQLNFFAQRPDYLICQTEEIWIRNGKRVNPMKKHKKLSGFIFDACLRLSIISSSCAMMRKEFFDEVGFFDEALPACEDYDLWLRASARFPIGLIEKPYVIKYGGHPDQLSRRVPVMDQFRVQALHKLLNSNSLSTEQNKLVFSELARKAKIISRGAFKRGKTEEAKFYEDLIQELSQLDQTSHL